MNSLWSAPRPATDPTCLFMNDRRALERPFILRTIIAAAAAGVRFVTVSAQKLKVRGGVSPTAFHKSHADAWREAAAVDSGGGEKTEAGENR